MYRRFIEKIKEYDDIVLFRHERPDGDAVFSQLGLFTFIKDNFPGKRVRMAGNDEYERLDKRLYSQKVSDSFIKGSLSIVLDTANSARIDDGRALNASFIVKIDHHPDIEPFADLNIIDSKASACSEILADMFFSKDFRNFSMSRKTCEYLYCGIIADSINFSTANTTSRTLLLASKLAEKGELEIADLAVKILNDDIETYKKLTRLRNHLKIEDGFGFMILKKKDLGEIGFSSSMAKKQINEFGRISDLKIWALAVENEEGTYDCSVRSKKGYTINTFCQRLNGGGHPNAAAVKGLRLCDINELFSQLVDYSTKKPKNSKKPLK